MKGAKSMRRLAYAGSLLVVLVAASISWGQEAPPPACEAQIQEQYRQLTTDPQLQAADLAPQSTAMQWQPQLLAIVSQFRVNGTLSEIKTNQAKLAEKNVAQLLEQLRLARQQSSTLQAEVERLKGSPAPSN